MFSFLGFLGILYSLGYYTALFLAPWLIYVVVFYKRNEYSTKDWFYYIKVRHAKKAIARIQNVYRDKRQRIGDELDYKIEIPTKEDSTSHYIYGFDQNGNCLSIRFTLHFQKIGEVFLSLRLSNGKRYILPGNDQVHFYSVPKNQWKVKGLNIEILSPFRKLRVTFNGLLKELSSDIGTIEHVQFNFIWNAASPPIYFPEDTDKELLARAVALEHWRDGNWLSFLPDTNGYEQFGALQGFVKLETSPEETVLILPSYRTKFQGLKSSLALSREIRICIAAVDGTLMNLTLQSLKNGCSEFKFGIIIQINGDVVPITKSDVFLKRLGENASLPSLFTAHITANKRVYKAVFHLNLKHSSKVVNNEEYGYELYHVPCEVDLNEQQAKGVVEFWYYKSGDGVPMPKPILTGKVIQNLPDDFVLNLKHESSQILELTGGKGNSLALMSTLNQNNFVIPGGFVVTTNAFTEQLKNNLKLKKSVAILDDICCGRENGKLEEACEDTIHLFKTEAVNVKVKNAIIEEINRVNKLKEEDGIENIRWAVRSSAIGEDSEDLSAAGQNETFLGCITEEDVINAVRNCWGSLFTFQSVQYRWQHGLPVQSQMAVVVQKMVPADSAGVLFTCHPTTSNPYHMVATSNYGLGESVVSAKSDPDTFILKKNYSGQISILETIVGGKGVVIQMGDSGGVEESGLSKDRASVLSITEEQALKLGEIGVYLEDVFGGPRDIEWAFYKDRLYLLQSRPITTLNTWTDFELLHEFDTPIMTKENVYTMANVGEVCPGAMTVLSQTTTLLISDIGVQLAVDDRYQPYVLKCIQGVQHHVMINVINTIHKSARHEIDISAKILDLAIFGHPVINEKIHRLALARHGVFKGKKALKEILRIAKMAWDSKKVLKQMIKDVKDFSLNFSNKDSIQEIYHRLDKAIEEYGVITKAHCVTSSASVFYQTIAMTLLLEKNTDFSMDHYTDCALILSSCEDVVSAEVPATLEEISSIIQSCNLVEDFKAIDPQEGVDWLKSKCSDAYKVLNRFLKKHGHRLLREIELKEEPWGTNPSKVIRMLQANCAMKITKKQKTSNTVEEVVSKLVTPKSNITRFILKFIISKMRVAVGLREKTKSEFVRGFGKIRIAYNYLAGRLVSHGILPSKDLIFHLSHHEIGQLIERRNPLLISKAMRRQRLYPKWNALRFEEIMYGIPQPEKEEVLVYGKSDVSCSGTPVCTGDVQARACVIISLDDIGLLKPGDILITYSTDIGWSPYFPMLSAVVTELGGLVSHGAVVAREYGLPCIVGVTNVTKMFKTGDVVQLSGKNGQIELISRS